MNSFSIRRRQHISWTPEQYIKSGGIVHAWLDASRPETIETSTTSSIQYVTKWNSVVNTSGNSMDGVTAARRPIYYSNGAFKRPCVYFDHGGSDTNHDFLQASQKFNDWQTGSYALSFLCAARATGKSINITTGDTTETYMSILGWNGFNCGIQTSHNSSGDMTSVFNILWWNAANTANRGTAYALSANQLIASYGVVNGTTSSDFTIEGQGHDYRKYIVSSPTTARKQFAWTECSMGCARRGSTTYAQPLKGEVYELLLITGKLEDYERTKALEYLKAKWGP